MQATVQDSIGRWSTRAIHDTVAAIAREPAFSNPLRQSLIGRLVRYLLDRLSELLSRIRGSPNGSAIVIAATIAVALIIVARIVVGRQIDAQRRLIRSKRGVLGGGRDAWSAAGTLAAAGDFTGACHALYGAVLDALARSGGVKRHASKTSGDYVRELRFRGSPAVRDFGSFAGDFDRVIYGTGTASAEDYARLARAAEATVDVVAAA